MKHAHRANGGHSKHSGSPGHRGRDRIEKSTWSRHKVLWAVIAVIIILLGTFRAALPFIVRHHVNHELQKSKNYAGTVGRVSISLWRGAYEVRDVNIFKRSGKIREPFFSAPFLDFSVRWPELFHGHIVTRIYMQQPKLNFVKGPTADLTQIGENTPWNQILGKLVPFKLDQLDIYDGQVHYRDDSSNPQVEIYFNELGASATNLSNATNQWLPLPAGIRANATTIGGGSMNFQLQFNPMAPVPAYQLQMSLTNVDLPALNNFFRAYGKFDVAHGRFAMFTSVATTNQAYEGYTKVFFNNLDVFEWKKERQKNILKIFWEAIVGTAADILKNHPHDQLATKIPISGVYTNTTVDLSATIGTLLRNAFISALLPRFDQKVTTSQVAQQVRQGAIPNANPNGTTNTNVTGNSNAPYGNTPETPVEKEHPGTLLEKPETGTNAPSSPP